MHNEHKEEEEQEKPINSTLRRFERKRNLVDKYKPPNFYCKFAPLSTNDEPRSFKEVLTSK